MSPFDNAVNAAAADHDNAVDSNVDPFEAPAPTVTAAPKAEKKATGKKAEKKVADKKTPKEKFAEKIAKDAAKPKSPEVIEGMKRVDTLVAKDKASKAAAAKPTPATKPAKEAKPAKEPKIKADKVNGVAQPKTGSTSATIWGFADALGKDVTRGKVIEQAKAAGINEATAATQYARWRAFNGLTVAKTEAAK